MRRQCVAQFDESAHDEHAHLHSLFAVEYIRRHDRAMFSEGVGKIASTPRPFEVANCDLKRAVANCDRFAPPLFKVAICVLEVADCDIKFSASSLDS